MSKTSKAIVLISISAIVVCAALFFLRTPIRNAAKIKSGDNAERVHQLLGKPTAVFNTTAELRASPLGPMSYVFTAKNGQRGISLAELPQIITRAEWFEYASAGHLVYYNNQGVTDIFWGGT